MSTAQPAAPRSRSKWRLPIAVAIVLAAVLAVGVTVKLFSSKATVAEKAEPVEETPQPAKGEGQGGETEIVKLSPEVARKYGIRIGVAKKRNLTSRIVAPARVAYDGEAMAIIGTPIQGRVVEVKARAGDMVNKRADLLVIESTELGESQSEMLQKHASTVTAKSMIGPATSIYNRARKLYDDSQGITLTELQRREVELRQAEGALKNAEAASAAAKNKLLLLGMSQQEIDQLLATGNVLPRYVVRSPLAGQVIERNVNLGELVKPDREKLFVVADTKTLWVWADIPESRGREFAEGAAARISLSSGAIVSLAAAPDTTWVGVVSHIAPSIDAETRTLRVRIDVKSNAELRPGMFVLAEIQGKSGGENAESVLTVPESAIQIVDGGTVVFVPVDGDANAYKSRPVGIRDCVDGHVRITSGLEVGERLVVGGSAILKADLLKATAKDED